LTRAAGHRLDLPQDPVGSLSDDDKVRWLERIDRETRAVDPRIVQVMASVSASYNIILLAASDGTYAADVRPLVRMNVSVIAEKDGRRETGFSGMGGRYSLAELVAGDRPLALGREAARQALVNLEAVPAPAGAMTVVLGAGWPGVLLHEAIGHGLEGDFNRKGTSAFSNRIGERVASEHCTVVDDGTLSSRRGSLNVDDEGTPTACTTLIENGVLKGYLQDKLNARLIGHTLHRQRASRVVRTHDVATDDEHLHATRSARPQRNHRLGRSGHLRGELRWRSGRHHLG
jgi:TldD protein